MNYRIDRNNYHDKPKNSNIYTPPEVSQFIYKLLSPHFPIKKGCLILDPGCGEGSLLAPWYQAGYPTYGVDIQEKNSSADLIQDFLTWDGRDILPYQVKPQLVLCNPPFNGYGQKLGSEVWLDKIIELFGKEVPIVLFAPMGFRLNSKCQGKRWAKFTNGAYPLISSIISLPRDIFLGVEFHSEILIFNIPNLQPHYFYHAF